MCIVGCLNHYYLLRIQLVQRVCIIVHIHELNDNIEAVICDMDRDVDEMEAIAQKDIAQKAQKHNDDERRGSYTA